MFWQKAIHHSVSKNILVKCNHKVGQDSSVNTETGYRMMISVQYPAGA
jgi:hypothetical protein